MTRKCGFFDCNNSIEKGGTSCQGCKERKEGLICSACRQPQEAGALKLHISLTKIKHLYQAATIIRNKLPSQFQTEFDQLLPQLKLSASEQELITKSEKLISDFLASKGGKQDHIDWLLFCPTCDPEITGQVDDLFKNPQNEKSMQEVKEKEEKFSKFVEKAQEAMSQEEWKKFSEETEEEFYSQIAVNPDPNRSPNQQSPNQPGQPQPNQNDNNSAKITQLQQEINSLKQEIRDLKNSRNPSPASPNTLQEKESKLREKEKELDKLTNQDNNSPSNKQPNKDGNSNLLLYFGLGALGVVIIILLAALLISQKKKKKPSLNWQNNWYNRLKNI